jgi:hypothetical protein
VPGGHEPRHEVAADVAGSADDENFHLSVLSSETSRR